MTVVLCVLAYLTIGAMVAGLWANVGGGDIADEDAFWMVLLWPVAVVALVPVLLVLLLIEVYERFKKIGGKK